MGKCQVAAVVIVGFILGLFCSNIYAEEPLVINGGLEGEYQELPEEAGFIAPGWIATDNLYRYGEWSVKIDDVHSGTCSQKINIQAKSGRGIQQNNTTASMEEGKNYELSFWYKGLAGKVSLTELRVDNTQFLVGTSEKAYVEFPSASQWTEFTAQFTPEEDVSSFILRIYFQGTGKVLIDDVSIKQIEKV